MYDLVVKNLLYARISCEKEEIWVSHWLVVVVEKIFSSMSNFWSFSTAAENFNLYSVDRRSLELSTRFPKKLNYALVMIFTNMKTPSSCTLNTKLYLTVSYWLSGPRNSFLSRSMITEFEICLKKGKKHFSQNCLEKLVVLDKDRCLIKNLG